MYTIALKCLRFFGIQMIESMSHSWSRTYTYQPIRYAYVEKEEMNRQFDRPTGISRDQRECCIRANSISILSVQANKSIEIIFSFDDDWFKFPYYSVICTHSIAEAMPDTGIQSSLPGASPSTYLFIYLYWTIHRCKCISMHHQMHLTVPHFTISNWCWKLPFKQRWLRKNKIHWLNNKHAQLWKKFSSFFWINIVINFYCFALTVKKSSSNNTNNNKINKQSRARERERTLTRQHRHEESLSSNAQIFCDFSYTKCKQHDKVFAVFVVAVAVAGSGSLPLIKFILFLIANV